MKNADDWKLTKYVLEGDRWRGSRDPEELLPASAVSSEFALNACLQMLADHARGHLADFGCGKVPFLGFDRDLVSEVTFIDWPASRHQSDHIDIYADLNQPTSIADNSFDTILTSSVLEHI